MRSPCRTFSALGVTLVVTFGPSTGRADDSAAAQALFDQGKKAVAAHDYAEACPKFDESYRLDPAMGTLLNLADCYERVGKLATAWSKFLELASKAHAAGQAERSRIGRQRAAALAPRLSNLVIKVAAPETAGLEIKRDGTSVGAAEWGATIPADAGSHTVEASAPGKLPWSTSVDLGAHATTLTVVVPELAPSPPETKATAEPAGPVPSPSHAELPNVPPPERSGGGLGTQKVLALLSGGIGLAGIGVGSYFGLTSMSKHDDATKACPGPKCATSDGVTLWNDARSAGDLSTIAFIVGGVGAAGALALWFTAPKAEAAVGLGPGSIELRGTF